MSRIAGQPPKPTENDGTELPLLRPISSGTGVIIAGGPRKKAAGVRPWLLLDSTGQAQVVEVGKHAIMRRTGLPARDLRILDPLLSYPSTVLGRERAIVINLEHIKAIITAQEVLLLNSRDPSVVPFVDEIQKRILRHHQAIKSQEAGDGEDADWKNLCEVPQSRSISPQNSTKNSPSNEDDDMVGRKEQSLEKQDGPKPLPFEFVALEACLEAACSCLESEAKTLEQEANTALDKLTSKITTLNLERVRQIKSRLVAITGRVQKVRDELEHLLDDDEDMAEMYLTDKLQQHLEDSAVASMKDEGKWDDADLDDRTPAELSMEANKSSVASDPDLRTINKQKEHLLRGAANLSRGSHGTHTSTCSGVSKNLDVAELEMLLEAYFVQIDGILNKLSTLREYVDDTEDYINVMLDDKQNQLLQMGVVLTTATLVVTAFVVVTGIFGMNVRVELFKDEVHGMTRFLWTVGGSTAGALFLYIMAMSWYKHKRLLE